MTKLTLTFVKRTERTSAKTSKPYTSLSIKAREYNDKYLSGFGNKENASWKEGDEVEVADVKEVEKEGKTYLNFEMAKSAPVGSQEVLTGISELNNRMLKMSFEIAQILSFVKELTEHKRKGEEAKMPSMDIDYPDNPPEPNFDIQEDEPPM